MPFPGWAACYIAGPPRLISEAESCLLGGDYPGAFALYADADRHGILSGKDLYNAACAAAVSGHTDKAFEFLWRRYAEDTAWYADNIGLDPDLKYLHADARWAVLRDSVSRRKTVLEKNFDHVLRTELQDILDADQKVRREYVRVQSSPETSSRIIDSLFEAMQKSDSTNLRRVLSILDRGGWPSGDEVGDMSAVPFIVLQHAPLTVRLDYMPLVYAAAERGDLTRAQMALFEDRVAVDEGRKQKYGTQIIYMDGMPAVAPLISPDSVDIYRKRAGLPPMAEYVRRWGLEWDTGN